MPQLRLSNAVTDAMAADIIAMRNEGLFAGFAPMATASIVAKKRLPEYKLPQLSTLQINPTPVTRSSNRASRNTVEQELGVLLLVTMRAKDDTEFGQLVDFVNDLDDLFPARRLNVAGRVLNWSSSDITGVYDIDVAYEDGLFRSLLTVTWKALVN